MPHILVLYTGGTIGMVAGPLGLQPGADFPRRLRLALQQGSAAGTAPPHLPRFEVLELDPIDSADLCPSHWAAMAQVLRQHWTAYDGFVLLHGTDTMAWSASALAFMLRGANKPVVFTGAQWPLGAPGSDALGHVQAALQLAAMPGWCEVGLFFGRHLWRACCTRKLHTSARDAFGSPHALPLADLADLGEGADAGSRIVLHPERGWNAPAADAALWPSTWAFDPQAVVVLSLYPGISGAVVEALTASPRLRGLILLSYGAGNVPSANRPLMAALARAADRGVVLLNVTQCLQGPVQQDTYATGTALAALGAVPAGHMTPEAALAKLHVLLARHTDAAAVRRGLLENWCGEV